MKPIATRGATHNFQKPANWDDAKDGQCGDLLVRAELHGAREIVTLVSTWAPTRDELAHLNAGGVIELSILSPTQPPVSLAVVDPLHIVTVEDRHGVLPTLTINEDAHGDQIGTYDEHGPAQP